MERFDTSLDEYSIYEGPVYWSDDRKLRIDEVNSRKGKYFKVYKAEVDAFDIENDTTKMCRLSMDDLSYIDGIGSNWIMNEEEFINLKKILASPCRMNFRLSILEYLKENYTKTIKEFRS